MVLAFFEAAGIEAWCWSADKALRNAFDEAHSRATITRLDRYLLTRSAAERLLAVNAYSRISVARSLCEEIASKLCSNRYWEHEQPIFFATLIPKDGLVTADMRGIDLGRMKERVRVDLRGISYFGMFEPGHYASLPSNDCDPASRAVSWHPHLMMWGVSADKIARLISRLRTSGQYQAVVQELKPVHAEQIANGELPDVVAYLLKPPSHAYRVTRYPWVGEDGEVRLKPDGMPRFWVTQRRSELRKGERLRVFHAMKHLRLDEMLVAGGEGRALRSNALRKATNDLTRHYI
jgi:hypothetical protein